MRHQGVGWSGWRLFVWLLVTPVFAVVRGGGFEPVARWTFEDGWADSVGSLELTPNLNGSAGLIDGWAWIANEAVLATAPVPIRLSDWTVHAEVRILSPGTGRMTLVEVTSLDGRQRDALEFHSNGTSSGSWRWVTAAPGQVTLIPALVETNTSTTVHLTVVNTAGGGVRIYRDGLPIGSYSSGQPHVYEAGQARVKLGPPLSSWPNWMNVRIGEVALFDRALSPAEVVDLIPAFEWRSPSAQEASGVARVQLVRLGPVDEAMQVRVATRDGRARAEVDYVARDLSVEFAAGERVRNIEVPLINDDLGAGSRNFDLVFSDPEPVRRLPSPAEVWIQDDDELVRLVGEVDGDHREGGRVTVHLTRTGSVQSARRFQTRVRLVPTPPDALVQPARPGIDLGRTEHTFELGPGITSLTAEFDLPDDREADGLRGFRVVWESDVGEVEPRRWGWPGMPFSSSVDSWQIAIEDNEHEIFEQEVVVKPFANSGAPDFMPLRDSLVLVQDQETPKLVGLGSDGLPLPGFGDGYGRLDLDRSFWGMATVSRLPNGRMLLFGEEWPMGGGEPISKIGILGSDGKPERGFASGSPVVVGQSGDLGRYRTFSQHGPVAAADGTLWVVVGDGVYRISADGKDVRRLPRGEPFDQAYPEFRHEQRLSVGPDGSCWVLWVGYGLRRYRPDGTLDPAFSELVAGHLEDLVGIDAQGRCYGQYRHPNWTSDGLVFSHVVRVLPDGTLDARYPVSRDPRQLKAVQVLPDGRLIANVSAGAPFHGELVEFSPDGVETGLARFLAGWSDPQSLMWGTDSSQPWMPSSSQIIGMFVSHSFGGLPSGRTVTGFLLPNGTVKGLAAGRTSWAGGAAWTSNDGRVTRRLPWREAPRVGFARTGVFVSGHTALLPVRRSGSTAQRVKVRGEWQQRIRGQWQAGVGQTFEVEFPEGVADTVAAVRLPESVGRPGTREFLMRLSDAGAEDGADFGVCRVWALAPGIPLADGLQMHRVYGPDLAMEAVLTGVTTERGLLESAESPRGPWSTVSDAEMGWTDWSAEISTLAGATNRWAMPVQAGPEPMRFYRQR